LISWVQVFRTYLPAVWFLVLGILAAQIFKTFYEHRFDFQAFYSKEIPMISLEKGFALDLGWKTMALLALLIWYINQREKPVFLINFTVFEPPNSWKVTPAQLIEIMKAQECYTDESLDFMDRMLLQSGVGPSTSWPPGIYIFYFYSYVIINCCILGIVQCLNGKKADGSSEAARKESEVFIHTLN
jgi:3-ketoacyl-CoA synthase